ncbi:hypothetical protein P171DRAFT_432542 [Karstenula rhodostoma CBS 690.94]|uniref:Uncharacterized protein n=1 Tax=Karstenula rhodostoma CBS 690.94 TaxID=1392251 RepID=A0A9P4UCU9_9PLEO|nr:hypothetical protein P171DRAFT_432542 [Karstenula rhodostoma CBS 690.94]
MDGLAAALAVDHLLLAAKSVVPPDMKLLIDHSVLFASVLALSCGIGGPRLFGRVQRAHTASIDAAVRTGTFIGILCEHALVTAVQGVWFIAALFFLVVGSIGFYGMMHVAWFAVTKLIG